MGFFRRVIVFFLGIAVLSPVLDGLSGPAFWVPVGIVAVVVWSIPGRRGGRTTGSGDGFRPSPPSCSTCGGAGRYIYRWSQTYGAMYADCKACRKRRR
ncbi:hypothetical protein EHYA_03834 [Embleya hyalina]|uniref:Uncharacterized protein n=1 Tax=Embleya hyalina TaxID=516124 RepID=A0A401YNG0_9ACTN|nr:hypothetical protein EHYA_03834 [Embleya hyalina]